MSDNLCVLVHRAFCSFKKVVDVASALNISTEAGSRGASPPLGEAMVNSVLVCRTSWGWANSGWIGSVSVFYLILVAKGLGSWGSL